VTKVLYPGWLSLGGNEIINNPRVKAILAQQGCYSDLVTDTCTSLSDALDLPELSAWSLTGTNLLNNPSFEKTADTVLRTNWDTDPYFTMGVPGQHEDHDEPQAGYDVHGKTAHDEQYHVLGADVVLAAERDERLGCDQHCQPFAVG
jgi:hypothetical protein